MEQTFLEAIRALGIAGGPVFAFLWWLERLERKDCQKTTKDLLVQTLQVTQQAANSVGAVTQAVTELRGIIKSSTAALSLLIRETKRPSR